jgi:hypothetical protein
MEVNWNILLGSPVFDLVAACMVLACSNIGITVSNPVRDIYTFIFLCLIVSWGRPYDVLIIHQGNTLACRNNGSKESLQQS